MTLRDAAAQLGVSRTALYRHFKDKTALLARVALAGFRIFRMALQDAVDSARKNGSDPIAAMGVAYVNFAMANQSHYKTMFSGAIADWSEYPGLELEADGAFTVLVKTIVEEQQAGRVIEGDPLPLANVVWAGVHGLATLGMAGHLDPRDGGKLDLDGLAHVHARIMRYGLSKAGRAT